MIVAELVHNPYLLITEVKFNGNPPRINSQIEKYEHKTLSEWSEFIPKIFYDEMNGYDFDLYFTGTIHDFNRIKSVFLKSGITEDQVRLYLKNEIEGTKEKSNEIESFLEWLKQNQNRKFNFDNFFRENSELFEGNYPCIIIRGTLQSNNSQIGIESINNVEELNSTLLTNTPIIFYVEEETMFEFRNDLMKLLKRNDVEQKQLFFIFKPGEYSMVAEPPNP